MLTNEQAKQIKEQLLAQLDNFPDDKREQIKEQIQSMSNEQIEEFLKNQSQNQCIFCSIISGTTPSTRIAESEKEIAILEINPLTRGHSIIISKKHKDKPSLEFAKQIAQIIKEKLNAKEIQVQATEIMGHKIINLIPTYEETDLKKSQRTQTKRQDLEKLQKEITSKKTTPKIKQPETPKSEPIPKLPPKIP